MIRPGTIFLMDCLKGLDQVADDTVTLVHTSPPYNIGKDYSGYDDSRAKTEYLGFIADVIREFYRVLHPGGSIFWQTGYTSFEDEHIYPIDHLTFDIFLESGFKLKDRIIWRYFGGMSFKNKFTNKHETILWWVKPGKNGKQCYFDVFPIREKSKELDPRNNLFGRNPGNVWEVDRVAYGSLQQTSHIAVFPEEISDRIVMSTTRPGDTCLDPFSGSGTLCKIAKARGRLFLGFEIAEKYHEESLKRLALIPTGEYSNILSSLIKLYAFEKRKTVPLGRMFDYVHLLLSSLDILSTGLIKSEHEYQSLLQGKDVLSKKRKVEFWADTEAFFDDVKNRTEPLYILDQCFQHSFRLTKAYNGVMRIYNVMKWFHEFKQHEHQLFDDVEELVEEEHESFTRKGNAITLINRFRRIKDCVPTKGRESFQGSLIR